MCTITLLLMLVLTLTYIVGNFLLPSLFTFHTSLLPFPSSPSFLFLKPFSSPPPFSFSPRCYLKLGDWRTQLDERGTPSSSLSSILQYYKKATEYNGGWYKAWHAWAFMNFQALLEYKQPAATSGRL